METNLPEGDKTSSSNSVSNEVEKSLYEKRQKIYPRQVKGLFASLRVATVVILLGLYFVLPWIELNGRQIILFDLPARKFYIFGLTFWPQDFLFLAFILILLAFSLFFFTALAGRLWCGYACFQTVWTEVFLWIERKEEGTRIQQMKLDKSGLSAHKIIRKSIKHFLWILVAGATGVTFVAYFSSEEILSHNLFTFQKN